MQGGRLAKTRSRTTRLRIHTAAAWRKRWVRLAALALAVPMVVLCFVAGYYYVRFAHLIDARLHGERATVFPRVFARPLELRRGQSMTDRQLIDRLAATQLQWSRSVRLWKSPASSRSAPAQSPSCRAPRSSKARWSASSFSGRRPRVSGLPGKPR